MTLTTPYSATFIVGDGETKVFSYLFEEVSENFISVMVYNSVTGLVSTPTYIVDTDQKQVIFGDDTPAPTADETVCIYRNTPNVQDTPFRTLQGYDAKALENILSKIVAMIQEIKSNYFSTQVLQGDPWQLDLLSSEDDGATVNIDFAAKKLVKGLYFKITNGNLQVSADDSNYITMPKSSDIVEFRQHQTIKEDLTVEYRLQYRIGNTWYNAESNAEATADEALQIAEEARDIASDAKDIAQDAKDIADTFDDRLTQAESDASSAKNTVDNHVQDYNNPHQVTASQVGLGNVDNTADLDKPISTATQSALDLKANLTDIGNATLTIQKNSVAVDTFTANATVDKSINITVPVTAADVNALPNTTKYVANASMTINNTTYVVTLQLKDQDGNNIGTAQTVDLPLESVVVSGAYDSVNKKIVLTLKDGSTIDIPVGDLVAGLQAEITSTNKLDADLVDDSTSTNKFVTAGDKTTWNGKQDAISDLATIRSNASNGASAYTTIQGYGNIVTHNASEFATSAQGALADTALQSGDNVSELVNDAGYITGITGSDVTTALGYTPYNSSNPSGYQANVIESIKVNGTAQTITAKAVDITVPTKTSDLNNDSGFITKSVNDLTNYTLSANLASVATTGTLASLTDTTISSLQGGQVLMYDADTGKWKNTTSTSSISWGGITGTLSDQTDLQNALNTKQATITGAATTITTNNLAAARAVVTDANGKVAVSTVTSTELGYMHGVTSAVQTQLNNKQATLTAGSNITISGTTISATDTTYTAGSGIDITSNVISVADLDCGTMS